MDKKYLVLKFYEYVSIKEPEEFRREHHQYCIRLQLRGRIKIAAEGINGTLSGRVEACEQYMRELKKDPRFAQMVFNIAPVKEHVHDKLHVRLKKEILNTGFEDSLKPSTDVLKRHYLSPAEFKTLHKKKDVVIMDLRSEYEYRLGYFEGALRFPIQAVREWYAFVDNMVFEPDKTYIIYCTRGIKCEKAREYLMQKKGVEKVYPLHGGILDYAQQTDGEGFKGMCYVFDQRLTVPVNQVNPTIVSGCHHCKKACERMINCANPVCNLHAPMCETCANQWEGTCSQACQKHPRKRVYDGTGYYLRKTNGYNPQIGAKR